MQPIGLVDLVGPLDPAHPENLVDPVEPVARGGQDCILSRKSVPQKPFWWIKFADPSACIEHFEGGRFTFPPQPPFRPGPLDFSTDLLNETLRGFWVL